MGEVFPWDKVLLYCLDCFLVSSNLLIQLLNAGITRVAFIPNLVFFLFYHLELWHASQTRIWPSDVSSFHRQRVLSLSLRLGADLEYIFVNAPFCTDSPKLEFCLLLLLVVWEIAFIFLLSLFSAVFLSHPLCLCRLCWNNAVFGSCHITRWRICLD